MKLFRLISHFGLFTLTAAFLSTPFLATRTLLSFSGDKPVGVGTVLSAESSAYSRYLRYLNSRPLNGSRQTLSVYVFPGQTTTYRSIYQVKNRKLEQMQSRLTNIQIKSSQELNIQVVAYFGEDPTSTEIKLGAGESLPVNLQLSAPSTLSHPLPVEVSFSLENE